jgi:hypothetical protein
MNSYFKGQAVRLRFSFTNAEGAHADPSAVSCQVKSPLGAATTYVYLSNPELVRDSTGKYNLVVTPDRQGVWMVEGKGIGENESVAEHAFKVLESHFD